MTLLLLSGCGLFARDTPDESKSLPSICQDGTSWTEGTEAFVDKSSSWGLDSLGADGVRIEAVDFDGDGWTDLAVRKGTTADIWADGIRNTWLLKNDGNGKFEDVTLSSGIVVRRDGDKLLSRPGPVWAWADVDNDGDLDVFTGLPDAGTTETETSEIMLNQGDGTFLLAPNGGDLRDDSDDNPFGVSFVDADRDGFVDLWSGQYPVGDAYRQSSLYSGDGSGRFFNATKKSNLETEDWIQTEIINAGLSHAVTWSAAACDLNDDGAAELLVSSYGRAPNLLFQNDGAGKFENRSVLSGYAFDPRVDWTDNESARCWCQLHPTDTDCAGVPAPAIICTTDDDAFRWSHPSDREPYRLGGNSGATMCGDVDNDGAVDLLTTEIVHWDVGTSSDPSELLFNTGTPNVQFDRPGNEATGLLRDQEEEYWNDGDITGSLFDFDNDGWLDVFVGSSDYPGTRALLWKQDSPRHFVAVPKKVGIDHVRSHGSAIADFDRDGDLDVVLGHSVARCYDDCYANAHVRLFENVFGQAGNFVQIHLIGSGETNRAAVGARVWITAAGITQIRDVGGGHGQWGAQDDLVVHAGLGTACSATVKVRWPDAVGTVESFEVGGGYRWHVTQGGQPSGEALQ